MDNIQIEQLSPEAKVQLMKELEKERKQAKEKRQADLKSFKQLSAEYVNKHIDKLISRQAEIEDLIKELFKDYQPLKEIKKNIYKIKEQDSHTSTLPGGSASITIGHNVTIGFDGTEDAGIEKIKEYMASLGSDGEKTKKLSKMVNIAFKRNKQGQLNPAKLIELNELRDEFNDIGFDEGLDIIMNAQTRSKSSMYVSGWKTVELEKGQVKKLKFRFAI